MGRKPRVVIMTRKSAFQELLARHGTRGQAEFFLKSREQRIETIEARHRILVQAVQTVKNSIPIEWRQASVEREFFDRFIFEPDDVIVVVGGNGLVANVAKYLRGQVLVGINPNRGRYDSILVPHDPENSRELLELAIQKKGVYEHRAMVEATLDDGQRLLALNEIFLGQKSHAAARYQIEWDGQEESQTSSGVIVSTGTGATGWAGSIFHDRRCDVELPGPSDPRLVFFVREASASVKTQTNIRSGSLGERQKLRMTSRMNKAGVIFGDGVEDDTIDFSWGRRVELGLSETRLGDSGCARQSRL
ncbi:MAG: hypothetical protein P1V97_10690, partial [Planctomycetota bacterium]|nr:hypothetical protein [Planctomycetota bacterium]